MKKNNHISNFTKSIRQQICMISLVLAFSTTLALAQDVHLSQFYSLPTYFNPAFTGATPHYRATVLYRNQWAGLPDYQFGTASFDYNWTDANSGIGGYFTYEKNTATGFQNMTFNGLYAFSFVITPKVQLRMGLQGTFGSRSIDLSNLIFQDQLQNGGATAEKLPTSTVNFFDVSAGGVIYSKNLWLGVSAYHLTKPSLSLLGSADGLPWRMSAQVGGKFNLNPDQGDITLMPALLYLNQNSFQQLMLGTNVMIKPLIFGAWYRGFPLKGNTLGSINQDALAFFAGFTANNWLVGYTYDLTISSLRGSGGSHELCISFAPKFDDRLRRGTNHIPCPITF
jgi:type IX secretion system PorP/SprF family membrane protein